MICVLYSSQIFTEGMVCDVRFFQNKSVRKNVTLDAMMAEQLARLSVISGLSQGELLEMALRQPFMARLMKFGDDCVESPMVDIIDFYQGAGETYMTQEVTEGFVKVLLYDVLPGTGFRIKIDAEDDGCDVGSLNEYLAAHMSQHGVDVLPGFAECKALAEAGEFLQSGSAQALQESRQHIEKYLRTMLSYCNRREVYANDFLMRNLVVIFRDFCVDGFGEAAMERRARQYRSCAKVLAQMFPMGSCG